MDSNQNDLTPDQLARRRTLKAFAWFGLAGVAGFGTWSWVRNQPKDKGILSPLRRVLEGNERLAQAYFDADRLAPTFPKSMAARRVRVNGKEGLRSALDKDAWRMEVTQPGREPLRLALADIQALPKHEIVFEFKCIEGWSQIQHWAGARFADFVERYQLGRRNASDWYEYVGMETPDGGYYVGIDTPSALHQQTLLAYEMNGKPLEDLHGAPLRLIIPVKYGVKNLKRIGRVTFTDTPPRDYWAERGYDYYIGL